MARTANSLRIAVVADGSIPNGAYRAFIPFGALAKRGHIVHWNVRQSGAFDMRLLASCDLVFVHRYGDSHVRRMAKALRDLGVALWWDNDDDILALPRHAPNYDRVGGLRGERIFSGMRAMMEISHVVSTPSPVLADLYTRHVRKHIAVVENYLPDDFPKARRGGSRSELVIGWCAGLEHHIDAEALGMKEVLLRIVARHRSVRVTCIGIDLAMKQAYRHVPRVEFNRLQAALSDIDIGLAPLADNRFNASRSNVKLKEYAAAGAPWLASPVGPYAGFGEREGGWLVEPGRWEQAIERLVERDRVRARLARRAARWAGRQTITSNVAVWEALAYEAVERARARRSA